MTYVERINELLVPRGEGPLVLDLFAGCGGLGLGFEAQGFRTLGFEMDEGCVATYKRNLRGDCVQTFLTPESDLPPARIVIGGPPCQPFSVGGLQLGKQDARDGFPAFIGAVRRLDPDIWLFENVRGLMYRSRPYIEGILLQLRSLGYVVEHRLLNAVDYGVPQNRERLIVVGHRGKFAFPKPEPRRVAAGEAVFDTAALAPPESKFLTPSMDAYVAKYERASACINPRDLHLNKPARTLTCRNLAGATGDMQRIKLPDGRRRRLLLREAARLQSFPDWFEFEGAEQSRFNQVGNAVAPLFAYNLANSIRKYLESDFRIPRDRIREAETEPVQLALL